MNRSLWARLFAIAILAAASAAAKPPKVLLVVAHPDDEYNVAATTYRITQELGGSADEVVITNGEGGYRYSLLAERIYRLQLTREETGRAHLPAIRKQETIRAGRILGIRHHYFLNQRDQKFTANPAEALSSTWDRKLIAAFLDHLLTREHYDLVFTLLPTEDTHGHHQAATLLALEAVERLAELERPVILGAMAGRHDEVPTQFAGRREYPITRTAGESPAITFDRRTPFGFREALNYNIVVNWVIAEHKSQGLFQTDSGKHDEEFFWLFNASGPGAASAVSRLAADLSAGLQKSTHRQEPI